MIGLGLSPSQVAVRRPVFLAGAPGSITFDRPFHRSGTTVIFTARRTSNIANAETHTVTLGTSTAYPPGALASDFGGSFPSTTAAFAAGAATTTATFNSVPVTVQPE